MPFTPAHAVVSLPFVRRMRAFSILGLVLGSMAPDFEYFLMMQPTSMGGHTILGFFILNVPICILTAILYLNVLEDGLIQLLPSFIAKKWPRFGRNIQTYAIAEWISFVYWALVGMLTHVGWDAFTHSSGIAVANLPILTAQIKFGIYEIPVYKMLQHGGTLFGLGSIGVYLLLRPSRKRMPQNCCNKLYMRLSFMVLIGSLSVVRYAVFKAPNSIYNYGAWIVSIMTYSLLSWTIISLILKKRAHRVI